MKVALILLLLSGMAVGQTAKKKPVAPKHTATDELIDTLKADLDRERQHSAELEKKLDESEHAKIEAQAKLAAAETVLGQMRDAGSKLINYTSALENEYQKTVDAHNSLVDKYNHLLNQAQLQAQLDRQNHDNRLALAIALLGSAPRYNPPPAIIQPIPQKTTFNCTTNNIGNTAYTNCN